MEDAPNIPLEDWKIKYLQERRGCIPERVASVVGLEEGAPKRRNIWGVLIKTIVEYFERIEPGSPLHIRSAVASVKAAVDYLKVAPPEEFESGGSELGHTLGISTLRIADLINYSGIDRIELSEGTKQLLEYMGHINEDGGRFAQAYDYYRASFPDKYQEKLADADLERERFPHFQKKSPSETKDENVAASFGQLLGDIKGDPIMSIDAESEMRLLAQEAINSINTKLK